jgi:hypothetical protein
LAWPAWPPRPLQRAQPRKGSFGVGRARVSEGSAESLAGHANRTMYPSPPESNGPLNLTGYATGRRGRVPRAWLRCGPGGTASAARRACTVRALP